MTSFPRRQRNRRLAAALRYGLLAVGSLLFAVGAAGAGLTTIALALIILSVASGFQSWRWVRLARRSAVGDQSERLVRRQLQVLVREGWRVRHSLPWHGGGDIDHIAIAPRAVALAFPIETKTRHYTAADLARINTVAHWLVLRRRGWCRAGAIPVLCLAAPHCVERWEAGVAVVSADRLVAVLSRLAGTTAKPRFLR